MKGWFDLFRDNGGPTLYAYSNRTSVIGDVQTIILYICFVTLFIAFVIVFPGMRKERFTTFTSVMLSLFIGTVILITNSGSGWHVSEAEISSAYRSFSNEKIMGKLGIYMGLDNVNVTLKAMPVYYNTSMDINFNERFGWSRSDQLNQEYKLALVKGLPFPILTVAEYLSVDAEGFCWGRIYRMAGYYTSISLWVSFALWVLMNIMLVVVPRYGAYLMTVTGLMMLFSNAIYYVLLPTNPLIIRMESSIFKFELGWCYWLCLVGGSLCFLMGATISIIDLIYPHKFSILVEMDYGTAFDRHIIIEDSQETKKKKDLPVLEEQNVIGGSASGFGGLLRRLSKRDRYASHSGGINNYAFEMETPKSPWRYPHLMFRNDSRKNLTGGGGVKNVSFKRQGERSGKLDISGFGYFVRQDSKDSNCSSVSSLQPFHGREGTDISMNQDKFNKFRRTDSSASSASSMASFMDGYSNKPQGEPEKRHKHGNEKAFDLTDSTVSGFSGSSRGETVIDNPIIKQNNEVTVVISNRKDSITNAVRRNSTEKQAGGTPSTLW